MIEERTHPAGSQCPAIVSEYQTGGKLEEFCISSRWSILYNI